MNNDKFSFWLNNIFYTNTTNNYNLSIQASPALLSTKNKSLHHHLFRRHSCSFFIYPNPSHVQSIILQIEFKWSYHEHFPSNSQIKICLDAP